MKVVKVLFNGTVRQAIVRLQDGQPKLVILNRGEVFDEKTSRFLVKPASPRRRRR